MLKPRKRTGPGLKPRKRMRQDGPAVWGSIAAARAIARHKRKFAQPRVSSEGGN